MPVPSTTLLSTYSIRLAAPPGARSIQPTTLLSAYSVQPAACYACSPRPGAQAPSDSIPPYASHPPFATHRASLHAWFPTQLHAMQSSSAQFSAQCPKRLLPQPQCPRRSQHPAHHTSRCLRHPAHHTQAPTALGSAPQAPAASGPPHPRRLQHPNHRTQAPTALARAPAASIPLYARLSQPTAQRVTWLPGMSPSCISCIKPRHANYLQCQRYACQAPIALRASTPQARATFRSWAPRSPMALRASAPWSSTTFHAPRSAPQAPPTFLAGLRFSIRCRASARQTHRASQRSSGRTSTKALFTLA